MCSVHKGIVLGKVLYYDRAPMGVTEGSSACAVKARAQTIHREYGRKAAAAEMCSAVALKMPKGVDAVVCTNPSRCDISGDTINSSASSKSGCPTGSYLEPNSAASVCRECDRGGFFGNVTACDSCKHGTYSPKQGAQNPWEDCQVCPLGTDTAVQAGYRACPCLQDFSRHDRFGACTTCLDFAGIECVDGYRKTKPGFRIHWTFASPQMLDEYRVFAENLVLSYDYQHNVSVYSGQFPLTYRCPNPDHCLGGIESGCSNGTTGPLCSVCGLGYSELNGNCVTCPESVVQSVLLSVFVILAIAVSGATFFRYNAKAIVSTLSVNAKHFQDADDAAVFHEARLKSHMHDTEELAHDEIVNAREVDMAMSGESINRHELKILAARRKALGVSIERHGVIVKAVLAEHALHAQTWYTAQIMTVTNIFIQYLQIFAMITAVYTGVDWSAGRDTSLARL